MGLRIIDRVNIRKKTSDAAKRQAMLLREANIWGESKGLGLSNAENNFMTKVGCIREQMELASEQDMLKGKIELQIRDQNTQGIEVQGKIDIDKFLDLLESV
jgi:hypothetical protein